MTGDVGTMRGHGEGHGDMYDMGHGDSEVAWGCKEARIRDGPWRYEGT